MTKKEEMREVARNECAEDRFFCDDCVLQVDVDELVYCFRGDEEWEVFEYTCEVCGKPASYVAWEHEELKKQGETE